MSVNNLISFCDLTPEEHRRLARQAGKASVESRRRKRDFKQIIEALGESKISPELVEKFRRIFPGLDKNITALEAGTLGQINGMLRGNPKCAEWVRDSAGQQPVKRFEDTTEVSKMDELLDEIKNLAKNKAGS